MVRLEEEDAFTIRCRMGTILPWHFDTETAGRVLQ